MHRSFLHADNVTYGHNSLFYSDYISNLRFYSHSTLQSGIIQLAGLAASLIGARITYTACAIALEVQESDYAFSV